VASDGSAIAVVDWSDQTPESLILRIVSPDGRVGWQKELAVQSDTVPKTKRDSIVAEAQRAVRELRENLLAHGLSPRGVPEVPTKSEVEATLYLPSHRPPVWGIRLGVDGSIWLELRRTTEGATWLVVDRDSGPLFTVTLSPGAVFGQATRRGLWYSEVDGSGVPWVVRADVSLSAEEDAH
jgi:hypothetical protein